MNDALKVKNDFRFLALTEDAVFTALDDQTPVNIIAAEVSRLVTVYADTFHRRPHEILNFKPREPIEIVALKLAEEYF